MLRSTQPLKRVDVGRIRISRQYLTRSRCCWHRFRFCSFCKVLVPWRCSTVSGYFLALVLQNYHNIMCTLEYVGTKQIKHLLAITCMQEFLNIDVYQLRARSMHTAELIYHTTKYFTSSQKYYYAHTQQLNMDAYKTIQRQNQNLFSQICCPFHNLFMQGSS